MKLLGCTFGDKHTFTEWGLMQISPPSFEPPTVNSDYLTITGMNGTIDLTELLTDDVTYGDRNFQCQYQLVLADRSQYPAVFSDIQDFLHGRRLKCVYDEDPGYYYLGRFEVDPFESSKASRQITIKGTCYPYKLERFSSTEDWLWDPFNFEDGIIREYKRMRVDGYLQMHMPGRRMPVSPTIKTTVFEGTGITMLFDGYVYTLKNGVNDIGLVVTEGDHTVEFLGNGTVTVEYRGGRL